MASVGAAVCRKRTNHYRGLSLVAPVVNLRNIPVEPNHDGWCVCLHDQLCKQIFVTVRRRRDGGALQVWGPCLSVALTVTLTLTVCNTTETRNISRCTEHACLNTQGRALINIK